MKPALTPELKERFFAMYWGQNIVCWPGALDQKVATAIFSGGGVDWQDYLLLRPISSITNEEAIEVAKICGYGKNKRTLDAIRREADKGFSVIDFDDESHIEIDLAAYDYLRSIGVALPFMGHSVEELIAAGWIKLTD